MSNSRAPCIWDETEVLLKASTEDRDKPFAVLFARAYQLNMVCFPRLHIVSDNASQVAQHYTSVPNVSFHQLQWPQAMLDAGLGHPIHSASGAKRINGLPAVYFAIQWPMMWADNFTSARHVLIMDTDTIPVLPMRCHHLFDEDERPIWYYWANRKPPAWVPHVNAVFQQAKAALPPHAAYLEPDANFMTIFPVVIPRSILRPARKALENAYGCHFNEAWLRMQNPSYGDLLGKTAALLRPWTTHVIRCPAVGQINRLISAEELTKQSANDCLDLVTVLEHVKHPFRDCHTGTCHHLSRVNAARYGSRLLERAKAFVRGDGVLPSELFHYQANRSAHAARAIAAATLKEDWPGRVCGVPRQAAIGRASFGHGTHCSDGRCMSPGSRRLAMVEQPPRI